MTLGERVAAVLRLLETRDDGLPLPVVHVSHQAGFVHRVKVRVSCEDCLANGRAIPGCESCGGRGFVEEWRSRDPYAVTDVVQPYGLGSVVKLGHVPARDAEVVRLERQLRAPWSSPSDELEDANRRPFGWELERRRMYAAFDYRALDLALEVLHERLPGVSPRSSRGLAFLVGRMPDPVRAPGAVLVSAEERALVVRDLRIRERFAAGSSVAELARSERLSASQIRRIVAGVLAP